MTIYHGRRWILQWYLFHCSLSVWSVADGELIKTVSHADVITTAQFSSDSQYLVTGSRDMSLKIWEAATGKLTQVKLRRM